MIRREVPRDRSWVLVVFLVALAMGLGAVLVSRAGAGTPPGECLHHERIDHEVGSPDADRGFSGEPRQRPLLVGFLEKDAKDADESLS